MMLIIFTWLSTMLVILCYLVVRGIIYSISNYYFRYRKARSSMSKEDIRNRKINKILGRKIWI